MKLKNVYAGQIEITLTHVRPLTQTLTQTTYTGPTYIPLTQLYTGQTCEVSNLCQSKDEILLMARFTILF